MSNCLTVLGGLAGTTPYYKDNILEFDIKKQEWTSVGNMNYGNDALSVSEVNFTDFEPWCQNSSTPIGVKKAPLPEHGKTGYDNGPDADDFLYEVQDE